MPSDKPSPAESAHIHLAAGILLLKERMNKGAKGLQHILDRLVAAYEDLSRAHPEIRAELYLGKDEDQER